MGFIDHYEFGIYSWLSGWINEKQIQDWEVSCVPLVASRGSGRNFLALDVGCVLPFPCSSERGSGGSNTTDLLLFVPETELVLLLFRLR